MKLVYLILFGLSISGLNAQTSVDKTLSGPQNGVDPAPVNVQLITKGFSVNSPEKKAVVVSVLANQLQEVSITKDVKPLTGNEAFMVNKIRSYAVVPDSITIIDLPAVDAIPLK